MCNSTRCPSPCCATWTCAGSLKGWRSGDPQRYLNFAPQTCRRRSCPPCGSASISAAATSAAVGWPGSYAPVLEKLFNQAPVDTLLLEYDSERASDFAHAVPAQAQDGRAWPRFLQECSPGRWGHLAAP